MEIRFLHFGRLATLLLSLLITILSLAVAEALAAPNTPLRTQTIECYLHGLQNVTSDLGNATSFTILPAVTSTLGVGQTIVASEILTAKPEISSQVLGRMDTLMVETRVGPQYSSVLLIATVQYDDGEHKGSIVLQGLVNFNENPNYLAVMGGTGDFVRAQGYVLRQFVSQETVGNMLQTVVRITISLSYTDALCEQQCLQALAWGNEAKMQESE